MSAEKTAKAESPTPPPQSTILAAIDRMRVTGRCVITSFAAIAVILVGSSQLSDLGKAEPERLWIAIAGAALALVAVATSIFAAARVFVPKRVDLDEITDGSELGRRAARDPGL